LYTNPHNIITTLMDLLQRNSQQINRTIRVYQSKQHLAVFEGMRATLPADVYPSLEIEPNNAANRWATTRAQRPRFTFTCTLTVKNENEKYGVEYITTVATALAEIMTSPENLQLPINDETKWDPGGGLCQTYMLDSLVEDATYNSAKAGTLRTAEFSWFVEVHEPYPESKWFIGSSETPSVLRPIVIE
jgi:hypothetical protein